MYYITQKVMDIGPYGDKVIPDQWIVELGHRHKDENGQETVHYVAGLNNDYGDGKKTASELGVSAYDRGAKGITSITHTGSNDFQECVGYIAAAYNFASWDTVMTPGGCMVIPPAEEWCKITTPEIVLDHGTITLKQADGNVASKSVGVQCTDATAVTFNLISNESYIYLDDGKSEITVNEQPLNSKIELPQGDSQIQVKDLLTGITKEGCLLYTSPSPRDQRRSRMPSSA